MCKVKNTKCYNCRFASEGFKVAGKTHHHCFEPTQYPQKELREYRISPWDTLREWWDTCDHHELLKGERFIDTIKPVKEGMPPSSDVLGLPF